jgi:hypothetical protein
LKILTFLSDFGLKSSYVSQMKGVALSITDSKIVDITNNISPHNILEGAFVLRSSVPRFPKGTVHVAVVDPGVGTNRKGIVITTPSQIFVGPDNGLLIPAAKQFGNFTVYEIQNPEIMLDSVSNTFHGRDIFTPVAAHILNGLLFEKIGPIIHDYVNLDFGKTEITEKTATGKIIYIDDFGNIVTNIDGFKIRKYLDYNKKIMLFVGKKQIKIPFVKSYAYVKPKEFLTTIGSSNLFEISLNQENAQKKLKAKIGDEVKILFN